MESHCRRLKQYLADFLAVLTDAADPAATGKEMENNNPPRMELIDFDRLRAVLSETVSVLETAHNNERDREIVRQWFINRIVSLDRGRRAILRLPRPEDETALLDNTPIQELVRLFEEKSARLRSTAAAYDPEKNGQEYRKAECFKPFKS